MRGRPTLGPGSGLILRAIGRPGHNLKSFAGSRHMFLTFDEFPKHFMGVDGDEDTATAGEDFIIFVQDFGGIDVLSTVDADSFALDSQGLVEGHRLQVFDGHLAGQSNDVMQFIHLAHRVIEDGGNNAAVAVAGRSSVALGQTKAADEGFAFFVESKFKAHAVGIVLSTGEAIILLHLRIGGFVAVNLAGHGDDCSLKRMR